MAHPWNANGSQAGAPWEDGESVAIPGGDAIGTWHVYGCKVAPDFITFYLDGVQTGQVPTHADYIVDPLYIIINYAMQNDHSGEPFASEGDSMLQVDWVRAYTLPSEVPLPSRSRRMPPASTPSL